MDVVLYEKKGKIAYVTINRPEVRNCYNLEVLRKLEKIWNDFRDDPNLWVAILTGAGDKAFCAGMDLKEAAIKEEWGVTSPTGEKRASLPKTLHAGTLEQLYKPIIAAVNGYAIMGGFATALACDIRIASENAQFRFAATRWGVGSTKIVAPKILQVGLANAIDLLLTARWIDAQEALRMGIVSKVVPPQELMPAATQMAEMICENGPLAVRAYKEMFSRIVSSWTTLSPDINQRAEELFDLTHESEDIKEGLRAFAEKRRPEYKAR